MNAGCVVCTIANRFAQISFIFQKRNPPTMFTRNLSPRASTYTFAYAQSSSVKIGNGLYNKRRTVFMNNTAVYFCRGETRDFYGGDVNLNLYFPGLHARQNARRIQVNISHRVWLVSNYIRLRLLQISTSRLVASSRVVLDITVTDLL